VAATISVVQRRPRHALAPRLEQFATQRRRSRLAVEISIALAIKFALLYVIWAAFFADPQGRGLDASAVAAALLRPPPSADLRSAP